MAVTGTASLVAVDWGTSHLRVFLLDETDAVLAERKSAEGMLSLERSDFADVLESHLTALSVPPNVPVMMCGMVGSRQGWAEAGYLPVPADIAEIANRSVRAPHPARDIRILPGLSKQDEAAPDVMRGEETQLIGLAMDNAAATGDRVVCMPGTHSKWVRMAGSSVADFSTFITGDLYAALAEHSVLRLSVGDDPVDPGSAVFRDAAAASLASPADISACLFSIRPAGLLHGLSPADARARLSGYLIGQELAGVRGRVEMPGTVDVIGTSILGKLYASALELLDVECRFHDGDDLVIAGLAASARTIWNLASPRPTGTH